MQGNPKLSCNLTIEPLLIHREGKQSECYVNISHTASQSQSELVPPQGSKVRRGFLLLYLLGSYSYNLTEQQSLTCELGSLPTSPLSLSLSVFKYNRKLI